MGYLCGNEVEILLLFIAPQFSIYIPKRFYLKRILRFLEEKRICVTKRPMHLSDFALISYTLQCQKKVANSPFHKGIFAEGKSSFSFKKEQILSHPET